MTAATHVEDSQRATVDVLAARSHYEVLGARPDASASELRRCYIQVSLRVHPDKNPHRDANKAFQRVAQAWLCLSSESSRQEYDTKMAEDTPFDQAMNLEEALMEFLRGNTHGSWSDTDPEDLFRTVLCRSELQRPPHLAHSPIHQSLQGVAFATGLWTTGCLADAAGFKLTGAIARSVGLMQGCSHATLGLASSLHNDEFRQRLRSVVNAANGSIQPIQAAASAVSRCIANQVKQRTPTGNSELPRLFRKVGKISSCFPSCLPATPVKLEQGGIDPGTRVKIVGLVSVAHLNGKVGEVLAFDETRVRYQVKILSVKMRPHGCRASSSSPSTSVDEIKLIKADNLDILPIVTNLPLMAQAQFI